MSLQEMEDSRKFNFIFWGTTTRRAQPLGFVGSDLLFTQ